MLYKQDKLYKHCAVISYGDFHRGLLRQQQQLLSFHECKLGINFLKLLAY